MAEYLLEVRCDEMPWRLLRPALKSLATGIFESLMSRGLGPESMTTGLTPRRLVVCCEGVAEREPEREERELGPPRSEAYGGGEPTEALLGFAERVGCELGDLEVVKTERGEYMAVVRPVTGRATREVLAEVVPAVLGDLRWKGLTMRWGEGRGPWVRPVRGLVSLFDGEVVPLELHGVAAGRQTVGHPVLSPEPFEVTDFADYRRRLADLGVEIGFEARREALVEGLRAIADELGGTVTEDPELLDRLTLLCEIPGVVAGRYDAEYLALPEEVLLVILKQQQSALGLYRDGELLPWFLTVMDRADDPDGHVRAGQERAVAGYLIDARFHHDTDRRLPLVERARRLEHLRFHPRLGTYADKIRRVSEMVDFLASEIGRDELGEAARQAAGLLKADLTTALVSEYSLLRGVVGGLSAREEGFIKTVWQAIYDQYRPTTSDGPIPRGPEGQLVAVADRLDTLVGFFGIGEEPTGSKDPRGLRRLVQGLLRIVIEAEMPIHLDLAVAQAVRLYGDLLSNAHEDIVKAVHTFAVDRLRQLLGQRGFAFDEIEAAMAVGTKNLPDLVDRLGALRTVREDGDFHSLVLTAKRIFNIVKDTPEYELDLELLEEEAEKDLYTTLVDVRKAADQAADERRYEDSLRSMADLVPSLDRFFAEVLVMDENESRRQNRMALLQAIRRVFWRTARLKEMATEKS